jgi:rSAM/selenodomain-associated transferase 2
MNGPAISVVIPVLNEQQLVGPCLRQLRALHADWQIIVVDGGSQDQTVVRAKESGADIVMVQKGGRGVQMRAGAERVKHAVLMFLHVDCQLPPDAPAWIEQTLKAGHWKAGAFQVRHRCRPETSRLKRSCMRIADRRSRKTLYPYGDQAVFLKKEDYLLAGGMPSLALMEDLEFAMQLRKLGDLRIVPAEVEVSARRFEQAPVRTVLCWWTFPWFYRMGVAPSRLAKWYGSTRKNPRS